MNPKWSQLRAEGLAFGREWSKPQLAAPRFDVSSATLAAPPGARAAAGHDRHCPAVPSRVGYSEAEPAQRLCRPVTIRYGRSERLAWHERRRAPGLGSLFS